MLVPGCPYCGSNINPGVRFCGNCGAPIPEGMQWQGGWEQPPGSIQQFIMWAQRTVKSITSSTAKLLIILVVGLMLAIGGFAYWQLSPRPDVTPPILYKLQVAYRGATSARIEWYTDEASSSQVEYGKTNRYGFRSPSKPQDDPTSGTSLGVTKHVVYLEGLQPSTIYHFKAKSKDAAGNETKSDDRTFKTSDRLPFESPF